MSFNIPKICVLTIQGKFSRGINYHTSLDTALLRDRLASLSIESYTADIEDCVNQGLQDGTSHVLFGGHPNLEVSKYMFDYALSLNGTVSLLPRLELIFCYENKGLQGLIADKYSAPFAKQRYHYSPENVSLDSTFVYKTLTGAGSSGVSLVSTTSKLANIYRRNLVKELTYTDTRHLVKYGLGKILRRDNDAILRYRYMRPYSRFILQQYVAGQAFDYKALVFGNKVYILKRFTRNDDFRASGSGKFVFVEADPKLLEFAFDFCRQLRSPFLSIDIIPNGQEYLAIEFQAINFGAYTQIKAPFFYQHTPEGWRKTTDVVPLEHCYADSVASFISHRNE